MTRSLPALALSLLALTGLAPAAALAASGTAPQAVTLRRADLPSGFKQVMAHTVTNISAALANHVPRNTFTKHGRISSYEIAFTRRVTSGMSFVYAETVAYRSSTGATWDYNRDQTNVAKSHLHRVSAPAVGDASFGYSLSQKSGKLSGTSNYITFRRGAWVATVEVQGKTGTVSIGQAASLARVIDGRIQAAGG